MGKELIFFFLSLHLKETAGGNFYKWKKIGGEHF